MQLQTGDIQGRPYAPAVESAPADASADTHATPDRHKHHPQQDANDSQPWQPPAAGAVMDAGTGTRGGYRTRQEMQEFFKENAAQAGVITLSEGLQYRVLNQGIGRSPGSNDLVVLDYSARLLNGAGIFDSRQQTAPVRFNLDQLAPGLREALPHMKAGSQWEVYVSPDLAYRGSTRDRRRFGYEPLVYVVDLITVDAAKQALQQE